MSPQAPIQVTTNKTTRVKQNLTEYTGTLVQGIIRSSVGCQCRKLVIVLYYLIHTKHTNSSHISHICIIFWGNIGCFAFVIREAGKARREKAAPVIIFNSFMSKVIMCTFLSNIIIYGILMQCTND